MKQFIVLAIGLVMIFLNGGCGTVATGKMQNIHVTSDPEGAIVRADDGSEIVAPDYLVLKRNKSYTIVAEHNCCGSQELLLSHKVSKYFWGNMITFGTIGMIVDASSGASDEIMPKEIHFDFSAEGMTTANRRAEYIKAHPEIKKEIKWAISNGIIVKKMTKEMVLAIAGEPDERMQYDNNYERFVYNDLHPRSYYFDKRNVLKKTGDDGSLPY